MKDQHIIKAFRADNQLIIARTMKSLKEAFRAYTLKHHAILQQENGADVFETIFGDAFWELYKQCKKETFVLKSASLKTYFFNIGINMIKANYKKKKTKSRQQTVLGLDTVQHKIDEKAFSVLQKIEHKEKGEIIKTLLREMSEKCREILTMYYFKRYSREAIGEILNEKSNTITVQKRRCIDKLKSLLKERNIDSFLQN